MIYFFLFLKLILFFIRSLLSLSFLSLSIHVANRSRSSRWWIAI